MILAMMNTFMMNTTTMKLIFDVAHLIKVENCL